MSKKKETNENFNDMKDRLQNNLSTIVKAGGWSNQEFANMLGVSKQTVLNLEKNAPMSQAQYIAIRSVLDYQVKENPDNKLLAYAVSTLLDNKKAGKEEKKKVDTAADFVSVAKKSGLAEQAILQGVIGIIGAVMWETTMKAIVKGALGSWMKRLINAKK